MDQLQPERLQVLFACLFTQSFIGLVVLNDKLKVKDEVRGVLVLFEWGVQDYCVVIHYLYNVSCYILNDGSFRLRYSHLVKLLSQYVAVWSIEESKDKA